MSKKVIPNLARSELDLERRTAYRFAIIAEMSMRCLAGMFTKKFDLSITEWSVLAVIGRYQPMFPSDVASRTSIQADKVTRTVDSLVAAGWVIRKPDEADRRRINLSLTKKGQSMYAEIDHVRRILETEFLSVLTRQESKAFFESLDKLERQARLLFTGQDSWKAIVSVYEPELVERQRD